MPQMHSGNILLLILLFSFSSCRKSKYKDCKGVHIDKSIFRKEDTPFQVLDHDISQLRIPDRFDARIKWSFCPSIGTIGDQGDCGGCWAFSSASAISDRICIATQGRYTSLRSTQDLLECCLDCLPDRSESSLGGCDGGTTDQAFIYWQKQGLVTGEYVINETSQRRKSCKPVEEQILKNEPVKICRRKCTDPEYKKTYVKDKAFASVIYAELEARVNLIQAEIMINGPVTALMKAFDYMYNVPKTYILYYDERLLKSNEAMGDVDHGVRLIGWDVIDDVPVWIVANSWNTDWCDNGFCYIRRGRNDLHIESTIISGTGKVTDEVSSTGTRGTDRKIWKAFCGLIFMAITSS